MSTGCAYYIKPTRSYCNKPIYKYFENCNKHCEEHYFVDTRYKRCKSCKREKVYFKLEQYDLCRSCFEEKYDDVRDYVNGNRSLPKLEKSSTSKRRSRSPSPKYDERSSKRRRSLERFSSKHSDQSSSKSTTSASTLSVPKYISMSEAATKGLDIKQTVVLDDDQFYLFKTAVEDEMIDMNVPITNEHRTYLKNLYSNVLKRFEETKVALHNTTIMSYQSSDKWSTPQKLNERLYFLQHRCNQLYYIVKILCDGNYAPV